MATPARDEELEVFHDELIDEAEAAELDHGAARNLFDLRTIIGALFTFYGLFLTIYGILDSSEAVRKAAGVRINLWTGLGMLVLGLGFLLWVKLRPLTAREVAEATAETSDEEFGADELARERRAAGTH